MARTDQPSSNHRSCGVTIETSSRVRSKDEIKELRRRLHLTQTEMAFMLGVPVGTLESWESGSRSFADDLIDINEIKAKQRRKTAYQNPNLVFEKYDLGSVRRTFGISCAEFAAILDCKWRSLEAYEQGRRGAPSKLIAEVEAMVKDRLEQIENFSNNPFRKKQPRQSR